MTAVSDDPDARRVFAAVRAAWRALPDAQRGRVQLATLPMADVEENALIVNALQTEAEVVVKKSLQEGFGLGVTEALWKARPVVATAVGGHLDQIEHGRTGLLVDDPGDLAAFGAAVNRVLADPERWAMTWASAGASTCASTSSPTASSRAGSGFSRRCCAVRPRRRGSGELRTANAQCARMPPARRRHTVGSLHRTTRRATMPVRVAIDGSAELGAAPCAPPTSTTSTSRSPAINDVAEPEMMAQLLAPRPVYGLFPGEVTKSPTGACLVSTARTLMLSRARAVRPAVGRAEGRRGDRVRRGSRAPAPEVGQRDIEAGREELPLLVLARGDELAHATLVLGANFDAVDDPQVHDIVTNASCMTNCSVPVATVLSEMVGINKG